MSSGTPAGEASAAAAADGTVIVTFALPDESRDFTCALSPPRQTICGPLRPDLPGTSGVCGGRRVIVVHTGVGDTPAGRHRLEDALAAAGGSLRFVVSAGYVGGLSPLPVGSLVLADNFSDPSLARSALALLAADPPRVGGLVSQGVVAATVADKKALAAAHPGTVGVDMETGWIAPLCAHATRPLLSLRVVSDAADQSLPVPGHILFDAARQRPRYLALPLWLLAHPGRIAPFAGFVRGLGPARARLTRALLTLVPRL